jgi:hypothetical protein
MVRVSAGAETFSTLFDGARRAGVRFGWLDLITAFDPPADLSTAAESGALRAVSVNGRSILSLKMLVGEPVLKDVIRENFTGCRLILVRGEVEAPELRFRSGDWVLRQMDGVEKIYTLEELLAALRSPAFP